MRKLIILMIFLAGIAGTVMLLNRHQDFWASVAIFATFMLATLAQKNR